MQDQGPRPPANSPQTLGPQTLGPQALGPNENRTEGLTAAELALQRKMKGVVVGLGVLILLAFAGVVFGMVQRASQIGKGPDARDVRAGAPAVSGAISSIPNPQGTPSPGTIAISTDAGPTNIGSTNIGPIVGRTANTQPWRPDIRLALPPGSVVKSTALQGGTLAVHHEGPSGSSIVLIDLVTGETASRVTIDTSAPR